MNEYESMYEREPITEEWTQEIAQLLHEERPFISYARYLSFLSQFIGQDMTEDEFTNHMMSFDLQEEVNQELMKDVKRGNIEMTVNEEGEVVFYEVKKKKSRKKSKR